MKFRCKGRGFWRGEQFLKSATRGFMKIYEDLWKFMKKYRGRDKKIAPEWMLFGVTDGVIWFWNCWRSSDRRIRLWTRRVNLTVAVQRAWHQVRHLRRCALLVWVRVTRRTLAASLVVGRYYRSDGGWRDVRSQMLRRSGCTWRGGCRKGIPTKQKKRHSPTWCSEHLTKRRVQWRGWPSWNR